MNLQPLGDRVVVRPLDEEDMKTPSGIGWGTDLNEDALKEHLWDK